MRRKVMRYHPPHDVVACFSSRRLVALKHDAANQIQARKRASNVSRKCYKHNKHPAGCAFKSNCNRVCVFWKFPASRLGGPDTKNMTVCGAMQRYQTRYGTSYQTSAIKQDEQLIVLHLSRKSQNLEK